MQRHAARVGHAIALLFDEIQRDIAMLGITGLEDLDSRQLVPLGPLSRDPVS